MELRTAGDWLKAAVYFLTLSSHGPRSTFISTWGPVKTRGASGEKSGAVPSTVCTCTCWLVFTLISACEAARYCLSVSRQISRESTGRSSSRIVDVPGLVQLGARSPILCVLSCLKLPTRVCTSSHRARLSVLERSAPLEPDTSEYWRSATV